MKLHIILGVGLFLGLGACAPEQLPTATTVFQPTATRVLTGIFIAALPTQTATTTATQTVTPTPEPTATATETIQPSPTPTVKPHEFAITTRNVHRLVQLRKFGRSLPDDVAWLPDGSALTIDSGREVSILSADSLEVLRTLDSKDGIIDIAISPDGKHLFTVANSVHVWDLNAGERLKSLGYIAGGIRSFALSANGRVLAIAGPAWPGGGDPDYEFAIIQVADGRITYSVQQYNIIHSVAVSPDGKLAAYSGERGIEIFNVQTGALLRTIKGFWDIAFGPAGIIVVGSEIHEWPAELWDVNNGQLQATIEAGYGSPTFSSDGRWLALKPQSGIIQIRKTSDYQLAQTLKSDSGWISDVAFSPDGKILAATTREGITLWNIDNGQISRSLSDFTPPIKSVDFSSDSNLLLGEIDKPLAQIWKIESGAKLSTTDDYNHSPSTDVSSPDGQIKAEEWIDDRTYPPQGAIRLRDTRNGQILRELVGHKVVTGEGFTGMVKSLVFNWDGSILASAGYDQTVRLWNVHTGKLLTTLPPPIFSSDINFSPNGRYLAVSSRDGTIQLWGLPSP